MNSIIETILSLKGDQLDSIIELSIVIALFGIYLTPLIIVIHDLWKRYDDKFIKIILSILAICTLPIFIIPYIIFRKETTHSEDENIKSEINILTTSNNCIKCTRCKEINRADYNFCIKCGGLLLAACRNCGKNIDLNWEHCAFCGTNLVRELEKLEIVQPTVIELNKIGNSNNIILKNKKILTAIGNKLNSLITLPVEIYR
ncbi:zinc ribbon domain-containing protein [Candidatus Dojkabacteria bacterium]|nr:zinc ribbon domain-containing protein [Candidatus Dojkabacteria bacterium]